MNILITGGTGFIGSNLSHRLINDGHTVFCLDNNYTGRLKNVRDLKANPRFHFIHHDVCESMLHLPELQGITLDQIYNLACPASPPAYQGAHSILTTKTCVFGIINALELALKHDATLLQSSTSEVYGDPLETPQTESYWGHVNPNGIRSCYDEGKRCAESLCFDYARYHQAKVKVIRIFNTYGPLMDPLDGRVISNFINMALDNKPLTIHGGGLQTRSFCYIDDLIEGMVRMMNSPEEFLGPVNLGNNDEHYIKDLASMVLEEIKDSTSTTVDVPRPSDDPNRRCPDLSLAKKVLHWQPQIDIREGIKRTTAYFRQEKAEKQAVCEQQCAFYGKPLI